MGQPIRIGKPEDDISSIQLTASNDVLEARLTSREIGSGLDWHINRAKELSATLSTGHAPGDYKINTDGRGIVEIADEIITVIRWRVQ